MGKQEGIRQDLMEIDSNEFSDFVADLWDHRGYKIEKEDGRRNTFTAVKSGGFFGSSTTKLVQPFYRKGHKVNKTDVNGILDLRFEDNVDEVVVVTTTEFTEGARKQGKRDDVNVMNGEELADLIIDEGAERVLSKYTPNGSLLKGLLWLFVILPLKITWFFVALPFKILFGSKTKDQTDS